MESKDLETIQNALALNEEDATAAQQLLHIPLPALRRAEEAVEFLQRVAEIKSRIHTLLEGPLTSNLGVGVAVVDNA